ncbi:peptidoglycan-binding protein [Oscillatoria sp. CS-180]|uniref:peptidoglycan-binding domain-containing protein n=1 Tax=Oscillatoria sp. CS-180 TaxID=3021720 RepID=UPI00232F1CEA|nr:peptidoglycan-binding protein [Oscillatoria sp. CS-180]MDB9528065.1 peptidoglycan-binding protein [Oscillatoria sp. CS-180]
MTAALSSLSKAIAATTEIAQASVRPTLRIGSTGSAVSELQALLTLLGYFNNPIDGNYEDTTEAAVQAFQTDIGITSDGVVGPATWEKLLPTPSTEFTPPEVPETAAEAADTAKEEEETPIELPTLRQGMRGPAVTRVQETLKARGFYTAAIDGVFGPATETAVMDFQRSEQLATDGVVGPATWQALLQ